MPEFQIKLSRNIGGQTFEASMMLSIDPMLDPGQKLALVDDSNKQLQFLLDRYAATIPTTQRNAKGQPVRLPGEVGETKKPTIEHKAKKLKVSMQDGKRYFKILTDKTNQYGLPIWPEILEAAGIDVAKIPDEGMDLEGYTVFALSNGGKSGKILRLECDF